MNAIEKIIETLENYVHPSQLDDARAELAALREVAEAAKGLLAAAKRAEQHHLPTPVAIQLRNAIAKQEAVCR